MKRTLHAIYYAVGGALCELCLVWWNFRDAFSKPKTDAVLFVAHPDDDTLFFHTFIKKNKPYICLMTTGRSLRRMKDFRKVMKYYGVRYRAYPLGTRDKRESILEKQVKRVLRIKQFAVVATHNSSGEYGHEEHIRVHNAVAKTIQNYPRNLELLCPVKQSKISTFLLSKNEIQEKTYLFKEFYTTEFWVTYEEEAGTPIWVSHERLEVAQI